MLAEQFAELGCQVTGIDPSEPSLTTARKHAELMGLNIAYQVGTGEHIPFADASFDIVTCCDVLEHVNDVTRVLPEISRVLVADGIFFYDTINRTFLFLARRYQIGTRMEDDQLSTSEPPRLEAFYQAAGIAPVYAALSFAESGHKGHESTC